LRRLIQDFQPIRITFQFFTTGKTIPELINNAYVAAELYYEEDRIEITHNNLQFEIDFKQFF